MGSSIRLVTSLGVGTYRETRYRWQGATVTSHFAPAALVRLLGLEGGVATALLTAEAADRHGDALQQALLEAGWTPELHEVPTGGTTEEQMAIANLIMDVVKPGEAILLDVTQGLRSLPFAYLAALTYLVGLQGNDLTGIFYAAYELKEKDPERAAPIFELTPLFQLLEWYQTLGAARETGDLRPVTRSLDRDRGWLFQQGRGRQEFGTAADAIERLARALAMGMPLEVGIEVRQAVTALQHLRPEHVPWPPARRVLEWLGAELSLGRWGRPLAAAPSGSSRLRKKEVPLTQEELQRQLDLAQWYADRYDFVRTSLLLREWLVNAAVWAYGNADLWLSREERKTAESRLFALERLLEGKMVKKEEALLGWLWQGVRKLRNILAHASMGMEEVRFNEPEKTARENLAACREALTRIRPSLPWPLPQRGRLVITPLGLNPGPLFTACRKLHPDQLVIVTSERAASSIDETLAAAGRADVEYKVLHLEDPFADTHAVDRLVDWKLREWLASASELVANVTSHLRLGALGEGRLGIRARCQRDGRHQLHGLRGPTGGAPSAKLRPEGPMVRPHRPQIRRCPAGQPVRGRRSSLAPAQGRQG